MVVYYVHMEHDSYDESAVSVTKSGRSRCNKDNARFIDFSVLCRTKHDALRCIDFHLSEFFKRNPDFIHYSQCYDVNDWSVTLKRAKVDSRDINFRYILMDGMREPLKVGDIVRDNVLRLHNIFGI